MKASTRTLLISAVALSVLALPASQAQARITNAVGTAVSASSRDSRLTYGNNSRCNLAGFTGTVTAATNVSGRLTFGRATRPSGCDTAGLEAFVTCTGTVTIEITRSPADTRSSAGGVVTLDDRFQCSVDVPSGACSITIRGRQDRLSGGTYNNVSRLDINVTGIRATSTGGACGPLSGTASFAGTYTISTPRPLSVAP